MSIYTVAVRYDLDTKQRSITCRDLEKSPHWIKQGDTIYDSRSPNKTLHTILFEGSEPQAKAFKTVITVAYEANGVEKIFVNEAV